MSFQAPTATKAKPGPLVVPVRPSLCHSSGWSEGYGETLKCQSEKEKKNPSAFFSSDPLAKVANRNYKTI